MAHVHTIRVGRAYDERRAGDGSRVLVDRLWPRGLSKEKADLDEWCKAVAPSTGLRTWFGHDRQLFGLFRDRYLVELDEPGRAEALDHLRALATRKNLTLLTAAKQEDVSHARVLADLLNAPTS